MAVSCYMDENHLLWILLLLTTFAGSGCLGLLYFYKKYRKSNVLRHGTDEKLKSGTRDQNALLQCEREFFKNMYDNNDTVMLIIVQDRQTIYILFLHLNLMVICVALWFW